jgi:hypothetical protein
MTHVVGQKAHNPENKTGIPCTHISLLTHLPLFSEVTDPLEVDNWLHTNKSKFGFLHYTEFQKTVYDAQQL